MESSTSAASVYPGAGTSATWATYDAGKGEVTLRRTAYDVQEVVRTIKHLRHDPVVEAKLLRDLGREI